jgi:hypothetical protein
MDWDLLSIACTTPSSPYVREYKNGRPIPTPFAPKHKALITSVPRRAPPSIYTWYQHQSVEIENRRRAALCNSDRSEIYQLRKRVNAKREKEQSTVRNR